MSRFAFVLALIAAPVLAYGHGTIIQLGVTNNRLTTHGLVGEPYAAANPAQRVYALSLTQRSLGDANDGWYVQLDSNPYLGPGISYTNAYGFLPNNTLSITFAGGLQYWTGSEFADPGTEQLQGIRGSNFATAAKFQTTDTGPLQGFSVTPTSITATSHAQVYWRLLGDGTSPTVASDDGVYLASFIASTTQSGITASDTYYFLLGKNATTTDLAAATSFINANLIPEPTALGLLIPALALISRRR